MDTIDISDFIADCKKKKLLAVDVNQNEIGIKKVKGGQGEGISTTSTSNKKINQRILAAKGTAGQAMFKVITGKRLKSGGTKREHRKGLASAMRLAKYIKKEDVKNLETPNGETLSDLAEAEQYFKESWEPDFTTRKNGSDFYHIVVSTPAGSDRRAVEAAARDFGRDYFSNHDYLMAPHNDTDYPHVHFMVKNVGFDGERLSLKKEDLVNARESFSDHARAHGINIMSVPRKTLAKEKSWYRKNGSNKGVKITPAEYFNGRRSESAIKNTANMWAKEAKEIYAMGEGLKDDKINADILKQHAKHIFKESLKIDRMGLNKDVER